MRLTVCEAPTRETRPCHNTVLMLSLIFRLCPSASDASSYLQLLASIITYLSVNEQPTGLSGDRILSLLCLWCATFHETVMLNQLLSSVNLSAMPGSAGQTDGAPSELEYAKLKTQSLSSLLAVLLSWEPSGINTSQTVLVIWHFGLIQFRSTSLNKVMDIESPSRHEDQTPICFFSLLRWFRKCLVKDRALQDLLVTENPASEVKLLLQLYQLGPPKNTIGLVRDGDLCRDVQKSFRLTVIREVNMICLVLLAAVQRAKREGNFKEGVLQPAVYQLISTEPYVEIITKGLEVVIFPLLPDPCRDLEESSCQDQGKSDLYVTRQ